MAAEFYNSPEQHPSVLHALEIHQLKIIAADTEVISLLSEIHTVASHKAKMNEFDTDAVELVLFVASRIEKVQNEEAQAKNVASRLIDLNQRGEKLDETFFEDLKDNQTQINEILSLFTDGK